MKSWSRTVKSEDRDPGGSSSMSDPPEAVWVDHTPTDDGDTKSTSSCPPKRRSSRESMKQRLRCLIPQAWRGVLHEGTKQSESESSSSRIQILPNGTRVSPPVSPLLERRTFGDSQKALLRGWSPAEEDSLLTSVHPAEDYALRLEVYTQKYSYLKSWPGLLRLLAGLELLFGGMVVACVIAYIQKDSEWSNSYGLYNGAFNNGQGVSGYGYRGPMTPFVLAVAGVSWIITFVLLVMGLTMYYRSILLDAPWWPLTEAFVNVAMFLLYMAAGVVYLNDLNRGGLCYTTIGVNPIMANLCRVDGGQMAGTAFIFINMTMYLGSFLVCLKMWRHEAARRDRKCSETKPQEEFQQSIPLSPQKAKRISFKDETDKSRSKDHIDEPEVHRKPVRTRKWGHVIADYIIKYPEISCVEEKEKYRAVFNDQYQEYKELHRDVSTTLQRFREMDVLMERLLRGGKSPEEQLRIRSLLKKLEQKKSDPGFLEKKERCDYLKAKLSHIKNRIRTFEQEATEKSET